VSTRNSLKIRARAQALVVDWPREWEQAARTMEQIDRELPAGIQAVMPAALTPPEYWALDARLAAELDAEIAKACETSTKLAALFAALKQAA